MIDIVGHFGSTLSYATVAGEVARAIRGEQLLGNVSNLDDSWHPQWGDLRIHEPQSRGQHVIVFAAPNHYIESYASIYGRSHAALFVSPNTDRLATEHAETCGKFGQVFVPSGWCLAVVGKSAIFPPSLARRAAADQSYSVVPLGVAPCFLRRGDEGRWGRSWQSLLSASPAGTPHDIHLRAVHLSTDRAWPGRKGTEELLAAWRLMVDRGDPGLYWDLILSVPPPLVLPATLTVADLHLSEHVQICPTPDRGMSDEELLELYKSADLVIAPSRCEGFGIMILAALVHGVPLVTTCNTGHQDFLVSARGWIGVPTPGMAPLYGEDGLAPVVDPAVLANTLEVAMQGDSRQVMIEASINRGDEDGWGTWPWATKRWLDHIRQWLEETANV